MSGRPIVTDLADDPPAGAATDDCAVTLQAAALLLDYPAPGSAADLELITAALAESPRAPGRGALTAFVRWWSGLAQGEREQRYVATFDLGESLSLYLTERVGGAPGARAARLLALRRAYDACGLAVRRDELPDYLPLMLEVAARAPEARALLGAQRGALERLQASLAGREDPFAGVISAVLAVAPAGSSGEATP